MERWEQKNWVLRKRFFFCRRVTPRAREEQTRKSRRNKRRSSCLPSRRHLIAADEEGGETACDEAMAILIVKARLPLDEWHFQMERQPAEHGDGLVGDQNVEANVSFFHFLSVISRCLLSNVLVYVCKCGWEGVVCRAPGGHYMVSCLLLGMPRISLENGWTTMGAEVGVMAPPMGPPPLLLPPPLLYHPPPVPEALLAPIMELTPC